MSDDIALAEVDVPPLAEDLRLYSVTTIIKAVSSNEGLIYWAADETAKAAVKSLKTLHAIIEESGEQAAIDWLGQARFRGPKGGRSATELGTAVHAVLEEYALTEERPKVDEELTPYIDAFDAWAQKFSPTYHAAEMTVYKTLPAAPGEEASGYAGTLDAIMELDGVPLIVDYKVTKKTKTKQGKPTSPFPTVAKQLAAYRYADFAAAWRVRRWENFRRRFYLLGADERIMGVPIPKVDGGLCIHITPELCTAYPVECGPEIYDAFLCSLDDARWEFELAKRVIGEPLVAVA